MARIGLGLRALKGGCVAVAVSVEDDQPHILLSTFLPTAAADDRLAFEPYRIAAEMVAGGGALTEAEAAVAEAQGRQRDLAAAGLDGIVRDLGAVDDRLLCAALLVNRAGWVTDLLQYGLSWPDHVPVAELLGVRDAVRVGAERAGIEIIELDEKSLVESASRDLGIKADDFPFILKIMGAAQSRPWRKEQKQACLAAWIAARKP